MDIHCTFFGEENEPNITDTLLGIEGKSKV